MVSHRSLSDSKSPQVSRTLLSILADLNNVVVWMVSTRPIISESSGPCISLSVTIPRAQIRICITVTFMSHSFFNSLARPRYFSFSLSFNFTQWSAGTTKSTIRQDLVVWPRLGDPFVSQNRIGVCVFHPPGQILGCAHTICSHGSTIISCTIPIGSPCPPSHV